MKISGDTDARLAALRRLLEGNETGTLGVDELDFVIASSRHLGLDAVLELDASLARGLNYYTGTIIEVKANDVEIGSITGGGRYDNLTGIFGMPGVSGVGISFGADRIYDVLNSLDLYPEGTSSSVRIMFTNFGHEEATATLAVIKKLRAAGLAAEIYPEASKMKKQIGYADAMKIPYVGIIGENEMAEGKITVKNLADGCQCTLDFDSLLKML